MHIQRLFFAVFVVFALSHSNIGTVSAATLFHKSVNGNQLASESGVSVINQAVVASQTIYWGGLSQGDNTYLLTWDLLNGASRSGIVIEAEIDYTPLGFGGITDNDFSFLVSDGSKAVGITRSDNEGGSWFARQGNYTPNANLPGFQPSSSLKSSLGAVETFTAKFTIDDAGNASVLMTEGLDTLTFSFAQLLNDDGPVTFAFGGDNANESYEINSVSIKVSDLSVVPIPAALPLLLSALGFFGFMGWRRKKATA